MSMTSKKRLLLILLLGLAFRSYGINQHWRTKDHYNFGGPWMQGLVFCLKHTPFSVSKGIPHFRCKAEFDLRNSPARHSLPPELVQNLDSLVPATQSELIFYRNHPPLNYYGLWGITSLLGDEEWVYRTFTLIFSLLNMFLVYRIGRQIWADPKQAETAALFQAIFLETIYFGTHVDVLTEFTVTFILSSTLTALRGRMNLAVLLALIAGFSDWVGFLMLIPLYVYARITKSPTRPTVVGFILAGTSGYVTAAWLLQTPNLLPFVYERIINPPYFNDLRFGWKYVPILYTKTFISSHSRMLSPLFCLFAFYELIWGSARKICSLWKSNLEPYHHAVLLTGGPASSQAS